MCVCLYVVAVVVVSFFSPINLLSRVACGQSAQGKTTKTALIRVRPALAVEGVLHNQARVNPCAVVVFPSHARIRGEGSMNPSNHFLSFFFFFSPSSSSSVEISSRVPAFGQGSLHSDSVS